MKSNLNNGITTTFIIIRIKKQLVRQYYNRAEVWCRVNIGKKVTLLSSFVTEKNKIKSTTGTGKVY